MSNSMQTTRHEGRKDALCILYQLPFRENNDLQKLIASYEANFCETPMQDRPYTIAAVEGVVAHLADIDEAISAHAKWSIDRMNRVDLAILRLGVYETRFCGDIPKGVTVHEAVELSKEFSSDEAPAFINGILGEIADGHGRKK